MLNISEKNIVPKYVAVSIVAGVIYLVNNLFKLPFKPDNKLDKNPLLVILLITNKLTKSDVSE
jgi:hypothetical protein